MLGDFASERGVGISGEYFELVFYPVRQIRPYRTSSVPSYRDRFPTTHLPPQILAGREGLEPSNARSKAWCLTNLATAQRAQIRRLSFPSSPINTDISAGFAESGASNESACR